MKSALTTELERAQALSDDAIVERVLGGEIALYEIIMRRHNQRIYRAARAILGSDTEAEDVMQDAYVRAFQNLRQFEGRAAFSTWLTRIAVNEAIARRERAKRLEPLETGVDEHDERGRSGVMDRVASTQPDAEQRVFSREMQELLEQAVDALPEKYRSVFVLREVEELDTATTAECLGVSEEAVKVRLHRARALLRRGLLARANAATARAFLFPATRCDRVVAAVFDRLRAAF